MFYSKSGNEIIRKNNKNIRKALLLFGLTILCFISPNPAHACDMIALISLTGYTIPNQDTIPGNFNDPNDFFEFIKECSDSLTNDDGYGILYYKDGEVVVDSTQKWYKIGFGSWYGDGADDPLDLAIDEIMNEENDAVFVFGHDRNGEIGYGSHPFTFEWQYTTYTFIHNGTVYNDHKEAIMNYLGADWFLQHPSNWNGQYGDIDLFIDSELLFHYIMKHIIDNAGNVISGIYAALNNANVEGYNLQEEFSRGLPVINFILSDGISLYIFRNFRLLGNTLNLSYEIYDDKFIGVKTQESLDNRILPNTLVKISRNEEPLSIEYYNPQFSAESDSGFVSLEVNFFDESNGDPTSWQWDFQNDGIYDSFEQNPTFIYDFPGMYDVKLKINGSTFVDSLVKFNYITVSDTLPPVVDFTPDSFYFFLELGESDSDILTIGNTGPTNLVFSIEKEYPQDRSSGGSDTYGYTWKDSDEPEGPEYNWIDISNNGTEVVFTDNDQAVGSFDIGFDFSFYGDMYDEFIISPNGWIGFGEDNTEWNNTSIPSVDAPRPAVLGFWDDLDPMQGGNVYYYSNGIDTLVVWFDNVIHYPGQYNGTYDFEMILTGSGGIKLQYRTVNGDIDTSTTGIQNVSGTIGLEVAFDENYVHNNLAVEFTRPIDWLILDEDNGIVLPDGSMNIQLWVYADELEEGEYLCNLHITTNDPENNLVTIPVNLNIGSIALVPPENVIISYYFDSINISWDPVAFATSYKVYSSENPYNGFEEDISGAFDGTSWSATVSEYKKYYYVSALID